MTDEDRAADGGFTRCDAFRLLITATVEGVVDTTEARITPGPTTAVLAGDPLQARVTLTPGDYSVEVTATGPGGSTSTSLGSILHICPG